MRTAYEKEQDIFAETQKRERQAREKVVSSLPGMLNVITEAAQTIRQAMWAMQRQIFDDISVTTQWYDFKDWQRHRQEEKALTEMTEKILKDAKRARNEERADKALKKGKGRPLKKRRGRPPGSKNKPKDALGRVRIIKKRGRPTKKKR